MEIFQYVYFDSYHHYQCILHVSKIRHIQTLFENVWQFQCKLLSHLYMIHIEGLVQDCSNSIADALEFLSLPLI